MKLDPINLIGGFYQDDNLPWSAQDTVNWIPRPAEMPGTISQMKLAGAPGLNFLADIDDDPVRIGGFRNVEGRMFIVAGTTLYELNTDLTTTVRGTIPGAGPVTMAHNQLEFGNELSIGNGSGSLYVWNTWTSTFTVVSDDAATGSIQSVYLNRRIIHLDPFGRFGYPSDIDSATSYDSLDRFDSEASPDKLVGLGVSQFELVALSQRTTEFYSITDATEQPFRPKRIAINRGCASRNSIVQLGGTLAWLGDDGIFYRLQGYEAVPISTGPVNKAIAGNNWANCFGFVYEDRKHEIAYWTFPDGQTWGYDAWTGLIHRRESFGFKRWRINAIEKWNDMWIAGDFQSGRIYRIDWNAYHEAGAPLVASRTAPPIYNNGNKVVCPMIELVFDTGRGTESSPITISGDLPNGYAGDPLEDFTYAAGGGFGPYTFSISSGALPTGLTLNTATGAVTGNFAAAGSFNWTVRVTDSIGQTSDQPDSNLVAAAKWLAWVSAGGAPGMIESIDGTDWTTLPKRTSASLGFANAPAIVHGISYLGKTIFQTRNPRTEGGNPSTRLALSSDVGATWTDTDSAAVSTVGGINLWGLCSGGGFVFRSAFTGGTAGVWRSPDGETWTYKTIPNPNKTEALAYKGSRLVASNKSRDYLMFSDNNADTWTQGASAFPGNNNIQDVIANATYFFACSSGAAGVGRGVRYSPNGNTGWAASTITLSATQEPAKLINFTDDVIVLFCSDSVGSIFTSTDGGITFTQTGSLGVQVLDAHTDGRLIVCVGSNGGTGVLKTSPDGLTWTERATNAGAGNTIQSVVRSFGS